MDVYDLCVTWVDQSIKSGKLCISIEVKWVLIPWASVVDAPLVQYVPNILIDLTDLLLCDSIKWTR